jgi:hypothetical protein
LPQTNQSNPWSYRWVLMGLLVTGLLIFSAFPALSARHDKYETIEATAIGTSMERVGVPLVKAMAAPRLRVATNLGRRPDVP